MSGESDASVLTELPAGGSGHNTDKEWVVDFHGVSYIINLTVQDALLTLEIEDADTNDRWCADFTSQYIEEITLKAGNFKKFGTFVKMCCSGFSKDNDSVFMDVLTASDLEMLKARKTGAKPPPSSGPAAPGGKRYVILTYSGEFDRVHYPLPLAFESPPSTESLLRSVARLRARLAGRAEMAMAEGLEAQPEKDVRQIIAHLRQENTELRHRLRQADSRKQAAPPGQVGMVNELTAANSKLRRTVEGLRRELQEASASFEKQRAESQKELNKWKLRVGAAARDRLEFYSRDAKSRSPSPAMRDASGTRASAVRRDRPWDKTPYVPPLGGARARSNTPPPLPPVMPGSGGSRGRGAASSSSSGGISSRGGGARPRVGSGSSAWSPKSGVSGYTSATAASTASAAVRGRRSPLGSRANDHSSSGAARRPPVAPRTRSESPNFAPLRRAASSVGGRFDPTLYQQQKAAWQAQAAERPWSAGGRRSSVSSARERESGYSSRESDGRRRSVSANASTWPSPASSQPTPRNEGSRSPQGSKKRRVKRREKGRASSRGAAPSDSEGDERPRGVPKARAGRNDWSLLDSPAETPVPAAPGSSSSSSSSSSSAAPPMPFPTVNPVDPPARAKPSAAAAPRPTAPHAPSSSSPSRQSVSASIDSSGSGGGGVASKAKPSPRSPARRFVSAVTSQAIRWSKDSGSSQEGGTPTGTPQSASLGGVRGSGERDWAALRSSGSSSGSRGGERAPGPAFGSSLPKSLGGPGSPLRGSPGRAKGKGDEEISEIDRRIQALQSYLDNARGSLLSDNKRK